MKSWFVHYMMEYYDYTGKLVNFRGPRQVKAPDEYTARQIIVNEYSNRAIKLTNGSSTKVLKFIVTHVKEADNGR